MKLVAFLFFLFSSTCAEPSDHTHNFRKTQLKLYANLMYGYIYPFEFFIVSVALFYAFSYANQKFDSCTSQSCKLFFITLATPMLAAFLLSTVISLIKCFDRIKNSAQGRNKEAVFLFCTRYPLLLQIQNDPRLKTILNKNVSPLYPRSSTALAVEELLEYFPGLSRQVLVGALDKPKSIVNVFSTLKTLQKKFNADIAYSIIDFLQICTQESSKKCPT